MKVALVANAYPPLFVGGAEIAAHRQAVELVRRGHQLSAFCGVTDPSRRPYGVSSEIVDGVEVRRVNVPGYRFEPRESASSVVIDALFAEFLAEMRPDVVHLHNLPGLSLGVVDACRQAGAPVAVTFHDHWGFCLRNTLVRPGESRVCPDWSACETACMGEARLYGQTVPTFLRTDFIRFKLHAAGLFHFPSRYLMGAYEQAGFDPARMAQHTYGIAPDWFDGSVEKTPAAEGEQGRLRVAFVGYLGRHKGPQTLLGALHLLEGRGVLDRLRIDVVGDGDMADEIAGACRFRGWTEVVRLRGKLPNAGMRDIYANVDLFLNASIWPENEPLTLLEALASGTPVLATRLGGNIELVREGVNGWLYDPDSPEALAARLEELAWAPFRLIAMREAARASVADRTIGSYADFALGAYGRLLRPMSERPPPRLPSVVAVACDDFSGVDAGRLEQAARAGYWRRAEWVLADALASPEERAAAVALVSLDGSLPGAAAEYPADLPVVVVGAARAGGELARFTDVLRVADLGALMSVGERLGGAPTWEHA